MEYNAPYFSLHGADQFESPFDVIQHYLSGNNALKNTQGGPGAIQLKTPLINEKTIKAR